MGSCFAFLSAEDNAEELALLFPMNRLVQTHTCKRAYSEEDFLMKQQA